MLFKKTFVLSLFLLASICFFVVVTGHSHSRPHHNNMAIADNNNYYQGVYGFLNGFDRQDPIASLDEMAEQNINLVILYGTNYYVKTTVPSEKDGILEQHFSKIDRYLAHAHTLGIKVIMPIWRMPEDMRQVPYMDAGKLDTAIRFIKRYRDNPTVIGWYLMDEPILRLELLKDKAPNYFHKYVIPALDSLTEALDEYDTGDKLRFGVFQRYDKGNFGLKNGAKILINRYLTIWGHDLYPFIKKSPQEFQNMYYIIRNFYPLNDFVREVKKPFLYIGQAHSSDANPNWQQRMPTAREFLTQQVYPMLLMSDEKPRYHLGNLSWAFGVMRSTPEGRQFLEDVYAKSKRLIDLISTGIANGRIKDISQGRDKASYKGEQAIKAGIYEIPQDSQIFYHKNWYPHPFRGKKMAIALATRREKQDFSFRYPGKVISLQLPLIPQDRICTIEKFQHQYDPIQQETLFKMQIMPFCPTVLIFDTEQC
ncbi:hypothetical protein I4641_21170 [Waterburya agarophytonicola K14]|uniref:Uncharacterized protein n=1 Tax=Waterburya agarophytonicola KI4 TaxID=2874699 RepID=A0A964BU24_9CYAN|nr:hypothetical protein [Waterburya agarophytonicola]MCC0179475.1 hypothetical protein [Waterburya agarophytonicola KI4]